MVENNINDELTPESIIFDLISCMSVKDLKQAQHHVLCALMQGKAVAQYHTKQRKQIVQYFTLLNELFEHLEPYEQGRFRKNTSSL